MFNSATTDCTTLFATKLRHFVSLPAWYKIKACVLRRCMKESAGKCSMEDDGWHSTVENTTKMMIYFASLYFIAYEELQAMGQRLLQGNLNGHNEGEPCFNMSLKWFCILQQSGELQSELVRYQYPSWQRPPGGNLSTAWLTVFYINGD